MSAVASPTIHEETILVSKHDTKNEEPVTSNSRGSSLRKRSLAPPSSLVLSVALDEVNLQTPATPEENGKMKCLSMEKFSLTSVILDGLLPTRNSLRMLFIIEHCNFNHTFVMYVKRSRR